MNILMIAPEPYFEPRGTPFSEYYRIRALCALGHRVDLVTYPIGDDRLVPGLTIFRSPSVFGIRSVKTGPSLKKILLDIGLLLKVIQRVRRKQYDLVHTHEEGNLMGVLVNKWKKIPHLYDMHSSLVQQLDNFQFSRSRLVKSVFRWIERISLKNASSVIVICRSLEEYARTIIPRERLTMIENFIDETPDQIAAAEVATVRARWNPDGRTLVVYTGTLEAYQGIPLLIEAFGRLDERFRLLIVGGKPAQVAEWSEKVQGLRLAERIVFAGQRPAEEIPFFLQAADILVSPRSRGTNIPLKIYAYLKSGKPVVATNLYTHTQTLTPEISILTDPTPQALADGIVRAAGEEGKQAAGRAQAFCREYYQESRYRELVDIAVKKAVGLYP